MSPDSTGLTEFTPGPAKPSGPATALTGGAAKGVRPYTLILIRWITAGGQLATILVIAWVMRYEVPLGAMLTLVGAAVVVNLCAVAQSRIQPQLQEREAALFLGFDVLQIGGLLYLSGGLQNPFALLLLAPLMVSATILGRNWTVALVGLGLAVVAMLAVVHLPLPGPDLAPSAEPLYEMSVWLALSFSALFLSWYVGLVTAEAHRSREALEAARLALARERRLSSLGALAAAAAHELGTPLATISLVSTELGHDLPKDSPWTEDITLLRQSAGRCREILADLSQHPERSGEHPYRRLSLGRLVDVAAAPYRREGVDFAVRRQALDGSEEPQVLDSADLMHGLGNILQNAFQFARQSVRAELAWDEARVRIAIKDDGPGIPAPLIGALGRPPTGRPRSAASAARKGQHLGLGLFIAVSLLERSGAQVRFSNRRAGGAKIVVHWPRPGLVSPTRSYEEWTI